jgi:hypothetical protein
MTMDVIHLRCFSSKINFIFLPALAFASVVSGFYSRRAFWKRGIRSELWQGRWRPRPQGRQSSRRNSALPIVEAEQKLMAGGVAAHASAFFSDVAAVTRSPGYFSALGNKRVRRASTSR